MTILIVDDAEVVHKLIRVTFREFRDAALLEAKDGTEGFEGRKRALWEY
jgi:hypothetical protein